MPDASAIAPLRRHPTAAPDRYGLREEHEDFDNACAWKVLGFRDKTLDTFAPKSTAVYYWDAEKGTVFASKRYRKHGLGAH